MRPNNKIVYAPKVKYAENGRQPPRVGDGFFDWLKPIIKYKEQDLLPLIGLDAVTYLRFGRMMRWMVTTMALVMCVVLIPVDLAYNLKNKNQSDGTNYIITAITMRSVQGPSIWAHVAMSYVGTIIALGFSKSGRGKRYAKHC